MFIALGNGETHGCRFERKKEERNNQQDVKSQDAFILENVFIFELQSIRRIDCNLAMRRIESNCLKMTKAIEIFEF